MTDTDWRELLERLDRYSCRCGSGGPLSCEADCPGDIRDDAMLEALRALLRLQAAKQDSFRE